MRVGPAVVAILLAAAAGDAFAQASVPLNQSPRPRDEPLPEPPPLAPAPRITLPPRPAEVPQPLPGALRVFVKAVVFEGNTVVSESDLQAIAAPFVGRELDSAGLEELRVRVTRRYVDAGYVNSGAVIPDQDLADGVIRLRIVEGRLSEIAIGGANRFDPDYLRDRLELGAGPPLNVNALQERMQLMLQDPQIARMSAELAPGVERGDAVLRVDVEEAKRHVLGLSFNNNRSPVVGENQAEVFAGARNLFGRGDSLLLRFAKSDGVGDFAGSFSIPVTARGTLLTLRGTQTNSEVVEPPLDQLDLSARSSSAEVVVSHPLYESLGRAVNGSVTLSRRETTSYFLGQPSPFVPGAPNGRTTISVVRFTVDGAERDADQVIAGRLQLSRGIDAFNASMFGSDIPDSSFTSWLAQFQWLRRIGPRGQLLLRADGQLADQTLLGPERYSLGGIDNGRGYRKDVLVRDNGWFSSLEYRHVVANLPLRPNALPFEGAVRLAAFVDYGQAWDKEQIQSADRTVFGVGGGLLWEPAPGVDFTLYYGDALRRIPTPTNTLVDKGWHFRFTVSYPF